MNTSWIPLSLIGIFQPPSRLRFQPASIIR